MNTFDKILSILIWPFVPNTWRALILRKQKIAVYLEGGQIIRFYCRKWSWTWESPVKYEFEGMVVATDFFIDPRKIIAIRKIMWFR